MTLGTSGTHSRKCTAKDETGAQAPNKKGVNKMTKKEKEKEMYKQLCNRAGIFCLMFKTKEKDKKGFHKAFVVKAHYGNFLDAEEMFSETQDNLLKELKENLKEKFNRKNYNFSIQVVSDLFTIDPVAEEMELNKIKEYYESLDNSGTPETVH